MAVAVEFPAHPRAALGAIPGGTAPDLEPPTSSSGSLPALPLDPRLPTLGRRGIVPLPPSPPDPLAERRYRSLRALQGVAEGSVEMPPGLALALEYNLDGLNGVCFNKGCYLGQEMTARSHFVLVMRKRAAPVLVKG